MIATIWYDGVKAYVALGVREAGDWYHHPDAWMPLILTARFRTKMRPSSHIYVCESLSDGFKCKSHAVKFCVQKMSTVLFHLKEHHDVDKRAHKQVKKEKKSKKEIEHAPFLIGSYADARKMPGWQAASIDPNPLWFQLMTRDEIAVSSIEVHQNRWTNLFVPLGSRFATRELIRRAAQKAMTGDSLKHFNEDYGYLDFDPSFLSVLLKAVYAGEHYPYVRDEVEEEAPERDLGMMVELAEMRESLVRRMT